LGFTYLQYLQPNSSLQISQKIWDIRIYVFTSQKFEKKIKKNRYKRIEYISRHNLKREFQKIWDLRIYVFTSQKIEKEKKIIKKFLFNK
jgi:hypothetical protein